MRIALIFNKLRGGGAERIAGYLSIYLSGSHTVYLFLQDPTDIIYEYAGTIVDVGRNGFESLEDTILFEKKNKKIEVSISFLEQYNHINIRTRGNDAVIVSERCYQSLMRPRGYIDEALNRQLYPLADCIVAISEGVRCEVIKNTAAAQDKVKTIYNFFDYSAIRRKADEETDWIEGLSPGFFDDNYVILSIGRLEEQKDYLRLLRQFNILHETFQNVKLIIIGSGEQEQKLKREITRLDLKGAVYLVPYVKNPFPLLKRAKQFVLSSRYEGYGNVLLEAMALNVPVISVDCPSGPREILNDELDYTKPRKGWHTAKRGILVTTDDSDREGKTRHLADAMRELISNDKLRGKITSEGLEWVKKRSNEQIGRLWLDCIAYGLRTRIERNATGDISVNKKKSLVIYGAGTCARSVYRKLADGGSDVEAFVVSELDNNPKAIYEISVVERDYLINRKDRTKVIIGVQKKEFVKEVCRWLIENDFKDIEFYGIKNY